MQVIVSGKNIDIGDSIREYAEEHLKPAIGKYFEHAVRANVTLQKSRHLFSCDIVVNEGTGRKTNICAHAEREDPYAAFGQCVQKVEKQLRRYKRKLSKSHRQHDTENLATLDDTLLVGRSYILSHEENTQEKNLPEEENHGESPAIIAEGTAHIQELTVGNAVMKMDLEDLHALMFINKKNGHISMVHRRPDGNIAWVDSDSSASPSPDAAILHAANS